MPTDAKLPPPKKHRLHVVTATTNLERSSVCRASWRQHADDPLLQVHLVRNGDRTPYLGTVPAFRRGVDEVLQLYPEAEVIACLHDDVEITEQGWDTKVLRAFDRYPAMGLAGFGGAIQLGMDGLYDRPYDPMSLARKGFRSNMGDAERHGVRSLLAEPVACLDGFSQIGRKEFFGGDNGPVPCSCESDWEFRPWARLMKLGFVHHFYDGALGCLARRYGWETWYLPIRCQHYGGATAVGDQGYQAWAQQQIEGGDHGFWEASHKIGWDEFRDVLPVCV